MFRIPETVAEMGKERIKGFPVEGFVYGEGPERPNLMLVGEAPGEFEVIEGIPFIGRAGKELMQSLASIGLTREDVYITSAVRSRPYRWGTKKERDGSLTERKYNRPPTTKEIWAHAPVLDYELTHVDPLIIVTLGNIGLQRLLGKDAKVTELHGKLIESEVFVLPTPDSTQYAKSKKVYKIIPTFHPASVFYRPSHRPSLEEDWKFIGQTLKEIKNKQY